MDDHFGLKATDKDLTKNKLMNMAQLKLSSLMDPRAIVVLFFFFVVYLFRQWKNTDLETVIDSDPLHHPRLSFQIATTWDGRQINHQPVQITLLPHSDAGVKVIVEAPFFNDPPNPGGTAGETFPGLWDYEVAEVFFLNKENQYLEVELCPHGQHLILLLNGYRKTYKEGLPLDFRATMEGTTWRGEAIIPAVYFPRGVTKMNAYAIHGSGDERVYQSLHPVPSGKFKDPDFHRLEYFKELDMSKLLPSNDPNRYHSGLWQLESGESREDNP